MPDDYCTRGTAVLDGDLVTTSDAAIDGVLTEGRKSAVAVVVERRDKGVIPRTSGAVRLRRGEERRLSRKHIGIAIAAVCSAVLLRWGVPPGNWLGVVLVAAAFGHALKPYYHASAVRQFPAQLSVLRTVFSHQGE